MIRSKIRSTNTSKLSFHSFIATTLFQRRNIFEEDNLEEDECEEDDYEGDYKGDDDDEDDYEFEDREGDETEYKDLFPEEEYGWDSQAGTRACPSNRCSTLLSSPYQFRSSKQDKRA